MHMFLGYNPYNTCSCKVYTKLKAYIVMNMAQALLRTHTRTNVLIHNIHTTSIAPQWSYVCFEQLVFCLFFPKWGGIAVAYLEDILHIFMFNSRNSSCNFVFEKVHINSLLFSGKQEYSSFEWKKMHVQSAPIYDCPRQLLEQKQLVATLLYLNT